MRHRKLRKCERRQSQGHDGLSLVAPRSSSLRWVAAALLLLAASEARAAGRTNLLLVTLDTTRADRLGCYARVGAGTPTLDALARGGTLFENAFSPAPLTLVSHATILTGLLPRHHGVRDNAGFRLDASHATLASILKASGYRTAAAVSSAVLDRSTGIGRGFDTYDDRVRIGARSEFNYEERGASQVTDAALTLLGALEPPFFLWVHYYDPHAPYVPPEPLARRFAGDLYQGEIAFVDERLATLLAALERRGLAASTLIAVAGDHGESLGEHGEDRHDLFVYQATQRVPLILKGPRVPAGRRVTPSVGLVDLLPSILELLGLSARETDGVSLLALLSGPSRSAARAYEMESFFPAFAYAWAPPLALVSGNWKYIATPRPELYDLAADRDERHDLLAMAPGSSRTREAALRLATELRDRYGSDPVARGFGAPPGAAPSAAEPAADASADDDEERMRALASLGYVGGSVSPRAIPFASSRLDPKDGAATVRELDRARASMQSGKAGDAVRALEPLVAKQPGNVPLLATLSAALVKTGAFDRAIELDRRALALREDSALGHANLAGSLRAKAASVDGAAPGSPGPGPADARAEALRQEAAAQLAEALRLAPRDSESYLHAALLELERSRPAAAREILRRADAADAGDPDLYLLAGKVDAALGDGASARRAFERALSLDPRSGAAHASLGHLAYLEGDPRAAVAHYARALELAPSSDLAKTLGSIRLYALSDRPGALKAFRRARELARDPAEAREITETIREIEASP